MSPDRKPLTSLLFLLSLLSLPAFLAAGLAASSAPAFALQDAESGEVTEADPADAVPADAESIRTLYFEGRIDEAETAARALLESADEDPERIEARVILANCYRNRSRRAPEDSANPDVPSRTGWLERASEELAAALEISPRRTDIWLGLCELRQDTGGVPGLAACLGEAGAALSEDWRFAQRLLQFAAPFVRERDYGEAVQVFDALAGAYDSHVPTLLAAGRARFLVGRRDEGLAAVERAIELNPGDAMAHEQRGDLAMFEGDFETAVMHYTRTTRIEPLRPEPYLKAVTAAHAVSRIEGIRVARSALNRWTALPDMVTGEFPFATLRRLRSLIEQVGGSALDVYQLARTFASSNAWPQALGEIEAALALDRGMAEAFYLRGQVQSQLGLHPAAVESYERTVEAIESQPGRQLGVSRDEALAALGQSRAFAGDETGALEALGLIENADAHALQIGVAHDRLGRHEEAARWFGRVLSDSTNPEHLVEARRYLDTPTYRSLRGGS